MRDLFCCHWPCRLSLALQASAHITGRSNYNQGAPELDFTLQAIAGAGLPLPITAALLGAESHSLAPSIFSTDTSYHPAFHLRGLSVNQYVSPTAGQSLSAAHDASPSGMSSAPPSVAQAAAAAASAASAAAAAAAARARAAISYGDSQPSFPAAGSPAADALGFSLPAGAAHGASLADATGVQHLGVQHAFSAAATADVSRAFVNLPAAGLLHASLALPNVLPPPAAATTPALALGAAFEPLGVLGKRVRDPAQDRHQQEAAAYQLPLPAVHGSTPNGLSPAAVGLHQPPAAPEPRLNDVPVASAKRTRTEETPTVAVNHQPSESLANDGGGNSVQPAGVQPADWYPPPTLPVAVIGGEAAITGSGNIGPYPAKPFAGAAPPETPASATQPQHSAMLMPAANAAPAPSAAAAASGPRLRISLAPSTTAGASKSTATLALSSPMVVAANPTVPSPRSSGPPSTAQLLQLGTMMAAGKEAPPGAPGAANASQLLSAQGPLPPPPPRQTASPVFIAQSPKVS